MLLLGWLLQLISRKSKTQLTIGAGVQIFQVPFTKVPSTQFSARVLPGSFDLACFFSDALYSSPLRYNHFLLAYLCPYFGTWDLAVWVDQGQSSVFQTKLALFTARCCSLCCLGLFEVIDNSENSSWDILTRREHHDELQRSLSKWLWDHIYESTNAYLLRVRIHVKVLFISHGQLKKRITCRCSFCRLSFSFGASKN